MSQDTSSYTPAELLKKAALDYHRLPRPGKIAVSTTKPMATQRDLSLAYSPGVAEACLEIVRAPITASEMTSRANLVAVISNGTAVLGLGDIGALASKPVMEGKGCLFKKFAGIDVFDIELDETDPDALIETIVRMEPTFGGINLEDIKAPECFYIEQKLRERMKIPVFHDDQHGTAIVAGAFLLNALRFLKKDIASIKVVTSGAGAAAIACLDLMVSLGVNVENITACDGKGVIYHGRHSVDASKARYAQHTEARTLAEAIQGADVFLGLSVAGVLTGEMIKGMAEHPVILAMANPVPEILPEEALAVRPDAIIGTGRSDYPNQVNNVLCFPFIFRGALDAGATTINEAMKLAAVHAIAELARTEIPDTVAKAYAAQGLRFGREYLIPKPFDPRLIETVAPAVARAAAESGVATLRIDDYARYRQSLSAFVYHSGNAMQPVFASARRFPQRVVYVEGADERVLRAAQIAVDEGIARPVLVGSRTEIAKGLEAFGLRLTPGQDCDVVDPAEQGGIASPTRVAAQLLRDGRADAMLCGTRGRYADHLTQVRDTIGTHGTGQTMAAMQMLILADRQLFITDTHVNLDPTAEQVAEITLMAAEAIARTGIEPRAALLSHSNFGSGAGVATVSKMGRALEIIRHARPTLSVDGEMQGDAALSSEIRAVERPDSTLHGEANLLVMPSLDAANIAYNLVRMTAGNGVTVGGILLGAAQPVHILTPSSTVRRILNMTAWAAAEAAHRAAGAKGT